MLDKRAQSSGIAWFVATIVIFLILGIFYALMAAVSLAKTKASSEISAKGFYDVLDFNGLQHFLGYEHYEIFNAVPAIIFKAEDKKTSELFFSYVKDIYGVSDKNDKNICFVFKGPLTDFIYSDELQSRGMIGVWGTRFQKDFKSRQDIFTELSMAQGEERLSNGNIVNHGMIYPVNADIFMPAHGTLGKYFIRIGVGVGGVCNEPKK
jgi:hypothetical protein